MRRLIWILVILAALWCVWWSLASFGLTSAARGWFEDRRAEGWQAELSEVAPGGFPNRITARLKDVALADPATGLALEIDDLALSARTLWPGDVTVALPDTPILIATPQARWRLQAKDAQADLNLHPGTALELENMSLRAAAFQLETAQGQSVLGGQSLQLALIQTEVARTYALSFDIAAFSPGDMPRAAMLLPQDWPRVFDTLRADAVVTFDAPIDRRTIEDRRPQPAQIDLTRAEAQWGDMRFLATGSVVADAQGFADGKLTLKAENWQKMLDLAQNAGLLPTEFRPQAENVLATLAAGTGKTNDIDVTLTFKNGLTRLGFVPLGPAPTLRIR